GLAPRVRAASTSRWSTDRSAPSTVRTRNGIATNTWANTTAPGVNRSAQPVSAYTGAPTSPVRPATVNSATPPTTGGSTNGTVTSARSSAPPRSPGRASTTARGTPSSTVTRVATVAVSSDSPSAVRVAGEAMIAASVGQGARTSKPSSGITSTNPPSTAATSTTGGTRGTNGAPAEGDDRDSGRGHSASAIAEAVPRKHL